MLGQLRPLGSEQSLCSTPDILYVLHTEYILGRPTRQSQNLFNQDESYPYKYNSNPQPQLSSIAKSNNINKKLEHRITNVGKKRKSVSAQAIKVYGRV